MQFVYRKLLNGFMFFRTGDWFTNESRSLISDVLWSTRKAEEDARRFHENSGDPC
jgi:hypothetical protein